MSETLTITSSELPNENIVAIDGTSGSGKSTIARALAKILGLSVLETGSLYRIATLMCLRAKIDVHDEDRVLAAVDGMDFAYEGFPSLDGVDVSVDIKNHDVVLNVSHVAVHPHVRAVLTQIMRHWIVEHGGGVVEGRDITTVVAPEAKLRVFVDAPAEIRAQRRASDPHDNVHNLSQQEIAHGIQLRDSIDSSREDSPLMKIDGVIEIDTTLYPLEETVLKLVDLYQRDHQDI